VDRKCSDELGNSEGIVGVSARRCLMGADRLDVFAVQSPDNSLWHNRTQAQIKGFFGLNSSLSVFRPKDVLQKPVNSAVIELNHTKNNIVTGR